MKKSWTVVICIFAFIGIVTLCYFFGYVRGDVVMPIGKYYLVEIAVEKEGDKNSVVTKIDVADENGYLLVVEKNKLESHLLTNVIVPTGVTYDCKILGTGLSVYNGEKLVADGMFAEKTIFIIVESQEEIDGSTKKVYTQYRYDLKVEEN